MKKKKSNQGWANGSLNPSSLYVRGDAAHLYTRTQESIQHGLLEQKHTSSASKKTAKLKGRYYYFYFHISLLLVQNDANVHVSLLIKQ